MTVDPESENAPIVILCADDYGMSPAICAGIRQLAAEQRLSATSVMSTMPHWENEADALKPLRTHLSVGLHVNLTDGKPDAPMPRLAPRDIYPTVGMLALLAHGGWLIADELDDAIERQLDAFEKHFGFPPDHVDGHKHIHALPQVRDSLIRVLKRRYGARPPFVRAPGDSLAHSFQRFRGAGKATTISWLTGGFRKYARRHGFICNDTFAGVSSFTATRAAVSADFKAAQESEGRVHLIMCHPAKPGLDTRERDPIAKRREAEFLFLYDDTTLASRIWRPLRQVDGPVIDWYAVTARAA